MLLASCEKLSEKSTLKVPILRYCKVNMKKFTCSRRNAFLCWFNLLLRCHVTASVTRETSIHTAPISESSTIDDDYPHSRWACIKSWKFNFHPIPLNFCFWNWQFVILKFTFPNNLLISNTAILKKKKTFLFREGEEKKHFIKCDVRILVFSVFSHSSFTFIASFMDNLNCKSLLRSKM